MLYFMLTNTSGHPTNFSKATQRLQCYLVNENTVWLVTVM